jgi:hypothetical protein
LNLLEDATPVYKVYRREVKLIIVIEKSGRSHVTSGYKQRQSAGAEVGLLLAAGCTAGNKSSPIFRSERPKIAPLSAANR